MRPVRSSSVPLLVPALLAAALSIVATQPVSSQPTYATTWSSRYPASATMTNVQQGTGQVCQTCHFQSNGGTNWNAYGWRVRQGIQGGMSVLNAIIAAETPNSDADPTTASNLAEIQSGTQPGWRPGAVNTRYNQSSTVANQPPPAGILGSLDPTTPIAFCLGDGTGAACPCGNTGASGRGCASSSFASGAILTASGASSLAADTLVLTATDIPGPGLFFQANGLAATPIAFGDGHLCASVGIIRMGVVFPTGTAGSYPGGLTPNPISVAGAPVNAGDVKYYQCWYRSQPGLCGPNNFDLTQALAVSWAP